MRSDERTSIDERRKHLKLMAGPYIEAGRSERGRLLTEIVAVTELHHKSVLRLLNGRTLDRAPKKGRVRRRRYDVAASDLVWVVWESLHSLCAERLTPRLLLTARHHTAYIFWRSDPEEVCSDHSRTPIGTGSNGEAGSTLRTAA